MATAQAKTTCQVIPRLTPSAPKPYYLDGQAAQAPGSAVVCSWWRGQSAGNGVTHSRGPYPACCLRSTALASSAGVPMVLSTVKS